MRHHITNLHKKLKEHHKRVVHHVKSAFSRKEVPTEYVEDSELGFSTSPVPFPVLSKVKLVRFRKAEDFDNVRTLLTRYDMLLIHISSFQSNVDDLKRGIGRVKLLPSRGIKCQIAGLDTNWLVVTSENVINESA